MPGALKARAGVTEVQAGITAGWHLGTGQNPKGAASAKPPQTLGQAST